MSDARRVLHLKETFRTCGVRLTSSEARWLYESRAAEVTPGREAGTYDVAAKNIVGVMSRGDLQVIISPKVPVGSLMRLIMYARTTIHFDPTTTHLSTTDFITALAQAFAMYVRAATAAGLMRGYWQVTDVGPTLRGRVRLAEQISRHHGQLYPLELEHQEFGPNVRENRVLAAAIRALLRVVGSDEASRESTSAVRHELLTLLKRFQGVDELAPGDRGATDRTRLNARYWDALSLAELILHNSGLDASIGAIKGTSFLLDMWRVFEEAAVRAIGEALPGYEVVAQENSAYIANEPTYRLRPDVLIRKNGRPVAVLDTKYKLPVPASSDIQQMFMYAKFFGVAKVHLLYPGVGHAHPDRGMLKVIGTDVEIHIHVLNLEDPIDAWPPAIHRVVEEVMSGVSP